MHVTEQVNMLEPLPYRSKSMELSNDYNLILMQLCTSI